ncbi:hypothetical protein CPB83DRAFT_846177 [Crepidotus variabilis]|uniref:Uncharacterized protein n=1 Tax=Crepidotus variabilis TaxID=179855 RepID=A0A9P6EQX5_9AGAR|nr:hypothetical protein CPB83DRAFT_846177 [Crepidotus variabilis]
MEPSSSAHNRPPPRYASIALQLPKLPPEVVHGILGDLSIQKLLQISCGFDVPYIDQCICSHFLLRAIFQASTFKDIKTSFNAYQRIRAMNPQDPHPNLSPLKFDAARFCELNKDWLKTIVNDTILAGLFVEMKKYKPYLEVLRLYTSYPIPEPRLWSPTSQEVVRMLEALDEAEVKLNGIKTQQLRNMAKLVQEYPGMLRTRDNRSQEPIRNEKHIVDTLLVTAKMMEQRHLISGKLRGAAIFSSPFLFLCPSDRVLWLFLKTLQKYPSDLEEVDEPRNCHSYPKGMEVVLRGFSYIYPRQSPFDRERLLLEKDPEYRTIYTKYGAPGHKQHGHHQPKFAGLTLVPLERKAHDSMLPAAEKEIEWLTAFLEMCQHMARMEEQWKKGQTVGERWRSYYPSM